MKLSLFKFLIICAGIGFIISSVISLIFEDLTWFCKYGLISFIPQCTNPYVYGLLMTVGAIIGGLAGYLIMKYFKSKETLKSKK